MASVFGSKAYSDWNLSDSDLSETIWGAKALVRALRKRKKRKTAHEDENKVPGSGTIIRGTVYAYPW